MKWHTTVAIQVYSGHLDDKDVVGAVALGARLMPKLPDNFEYIYRMCKS